MSRSKPNRKISSLMPLMLAALGAVLVLAGCSAATAVSDTAPAFANTATVPNQNYTVGEAITGLTLPEAAGGNGPLSYTLQPAVPGLRFDGGARTLSGTPTTAGAYEMRYRVQDGDANTDPADADTLTFTITVREPDTAPGFAAPVDDRTYTVGDVVSLALPPATGGKSPLTYSLTPEIPGLTFDADSRELSGAPTVADTYPMTYRVVDADDNMDESDAATLTFTITVHPDTTPSFSATVSDQTYTEGDAVSLTLPPATGGNGALTYSLTPGIPGLMFDAESRELSGTATVVDTYPMTYRVVDADDNTQESDAATLTFTITVREPDTAPSFSAAVSDQTYTEGDAVSLTLPPASGGNGPLTYTLRPQISGLTFDANARDLSGAPTAAGIYRMTYQAADADDNTQASDAATLTFTVTVLPDTVPSFSATVADQTYTVGDTVSLTLPPATGGNGEMTYSLAPEIPGLTFDAEARELSGTARAVDTYDMTYRVWDADANTADSDTDVLTFEIEVVAPEGILSVYRGSGNQVFFLEPEDGSLQDTLYTLVLGEAPAEVYLIATNTTVDEVRPRVERLDVATGAAIPQRRAPFATRRAHRLDPALTMHGRVTEFHANLPPPSLSTVPPTQQPRRAVSEGDTLTFFEVYDFVNSRFRETPVEVPVTARRVVTDGTMTVALWVADQAWGTCSECLRQEMVDAFADQLLRPGAGNDIYDWVTAIFGAPWGPHDHDFLIPPEYGDEIHVVIYDVEGVGGYASLVDAQLRDPDSSHIAVRYSHERLLFVVDAPRIGRAEGASWEVTDPGPASKLYTLAHELQHTIQYYQKSVKHDFEPDLETWINEMSSEMAEDFVSERLMTGSGQRGLPYDDPTAGEPGNRRGELPTYNYYNYLQASTWEFDRPLYRYYSINYALGAYLARNYGGAALFGSIVQNDRGGIEAIEAALAAHGHSVSFEQILVDWAVANLLSDDVSASAPYRYNSGTWFTSMAGGETFRLGSINLFNYRYYYGEGPDDYHDGPRLFSVSEFNDQDPQPPHSNRYASLGANTGTVRLRITADPGNRITVVVKE